MAPALQVGATVSEVAGADHINAVVQLSNELIAHKLNSSDKRSSDLLGTLPLALAGVFLVSSRVSLDRSSALTHGSTRISRAHECCLRVAEQR